jgi:prevent-host-death family protein
MEIPMIDLTEIRSLTEFQRNAKEHIDRLKQTGNAQVLTVNGQAEVVIQSAESYQQLVEDAELAQSLRLIRKSLDEARSGKSRPMKAFLHELAAKHGIDLAK